MSLLRSALQRDSLRRATAHGLLALGLVAAGGLALLLAHWDRAAQQGTRSAAQARLAELDGERSESEAALGMLTENIDRYRALQRSGFVGSGDRIAWTEALLRGQQQLGLPGIAFELAPQQELEPQAEDPALAGSDAERPPAQGPLAHDMRIQIGGLHEGELLALLERLAAEQVGHFRPQACLLQRDVQQAGLQLDCTLRWITYLPPPVENDEADDAGSEATP